MKFGLKAVFALVLIASLILTVYRAYYAPPVLFVGMSRKNAIKALRRSNASDMIKLSISSRIVVSPNTSAPPTKRDIAEYRRIGDIAYSKDNMLTYWYLPTVGRFETHFKNDKLESIVQWDGADSEEANRLTLELRPDDPNEIAGLPNDF